MLPSNKNSATFIYFSFVFIVRRSVKVYRELKHAVVVLTFLVLFTFPSSSSAPTKMQNDKERQKKLQERLESEPKYQWLFNQSSSVSATDGAVEHGLNLNPVIHEIENAIDVASQLRSLYADSDLGKKLNHATGTITPLLPKSPMNHKKVGEFLVSFFNDMEVYAAFFEQVLWDLEDSYGLYNTQFTKSSELMSLILTELKDLIVGRKYQEKVKKFDRRVMPSDERCLDNSATDTRNFFIAKAYEKYLKNARAGLGAFNSIS